MYSQISAIGPEGHCTSHFKRVMCISCRPHVDVHKGSCGQGSVKNLIFLDVINEWPHIATKVFKQKLFKVSKV